MVDRLKVVLEKINNESKERDQNLGRTINNVIRQQKLSGHIGAIQVHREILTHVYEKPSTYTNLAMIGGLCRYVCHMAIDEGPYFQQ
jgi:hypothetical protein